MHLVTCETATSARRTTVVKRVESRKQSRCEGKDNRDPETASDDNK